MSKQYPVAFIAGKYRGPTRAAIELNIQAAKHVAALACLKGYAAMCPHMNTAFMDEILPDMGDQFWLDITMEMMRAC